MDAQLPLAQRHSRDILQRNVGILNEVRKRCVQEENSNGPVALMARLHKR